LHYQLSGITVTALPASKLYSDGTLRPAANDRTYDIIGPWTGEVVCKAPEASPDDVNARNESHRRCRGMSSGRRGVAADMERARDEIR
jgi:acyl-CoA reductase-like NAD-dependent aldehyde dehydrogenase